jgi:hypothetical protein
MKEGVVEVPVELLMRFCKAFLEMNKQGVTCSDPTLFEDLDRILAQHDQRTRYDHRTGR